MLIFLTKAQFSSDELIKKGVDEFCRLFNKQKPHYSIIRTEGEKPMLAPQFLHFNLTHSAEFSALAVSEQPVGIDLQIHTLYNYEAISKRFFEKKLVEIKDFFDTWAAKEAYAKCGGEPLIEVMKKTVCGVTVFDILEGYSLAIKSDDKEILFVFLF